MSDSITDNMIRIDEVAAQQDIRYLSDSIARMRDASADLDEILALAEDLKGNTESQIKSAALLLKQNISKSIRRTEEAIDAIRMTVERYQRIDSELKRKIDGAGN